MYCLANNRLAKPYHNFLLVSLREILPNSLGKTKFCYNSSYRLNSRWFTEYYQHFAKQLRDNISLVFDEWNSHRADPSKVEGFDWPKFRSRNLNLFFEDVYVTNEDKAFVFVKANHIFEATIA